MLAAWLDCKFLSVSSVSAGCWWWYTWPRWPPSEQRSAASLSSVNRPDKKQSTLSVSQSRDSPCSQRSLWWGCSGPSCCRRRSPPRCPAQCRRPTLRSCRRTPASAGRQGRHHDPQQQDLGGAQVFHQFLGLLGLTWKWVEWLIDCFSWYQCVVAHTLEWGGLLQ